MTVFKRLGRYFLNLFFPARCIFCREDLPYDAESPVCDTCMLQYPIRRAALCEIPAGRCSYALRYRGEVRRAILAYKFRNMAQYDRVLGGILADSLSHLYGINYITYVPVSALRLTKRGYDQSRLLAEEVGRRMGIPVLTLLRKTRHTLPQSRLPGALRAAHVQGVYKAVGRQDLHGKTVLLIDDIVTTGSTISACAAVLESCGARVFCAALAHGN